jgi:hypothetical protein
MTRFSRRALLRFFLLGTVATPRRAVASTIPMLFIALRPA